MISYNGTLIWSACSWQFIRTCKNHPGQEKKTKQKDSDSRLYEITSGEVYWMGLANSLHSETFVNGFKWWPPMLPFIVTTFYKANAYIWSFRKTVTDATGHFWIRKCRRISIEVHFKLQLIDMVSCHIHHLFQVNGLFKLSLSQIAEHTYLPEMCQLSLSPKFSSSSTICFFISQCHSSLLSLFIILLLLSCTFFSLLVYIFCVLLIPPPLFFKAV